MKVGDVVFTPAGDQALIEQIDEYRDGLVALVTVEFIDGREELRKFYLDELEVAIPAYVDGDD